MLIHRKTGGRSGDSGGVCGSSGAGASEGRDGGPEGEPEPGGTGVSDGGGEADSGRSVQRKEGGGRLWMRVSLRRFYI